MLRNIILSLLIQSYFKHIPRHYECEYEKSILKHGYILPDTKHNTEKLSNNEIDERYNENNEEDIANIRVYNSKITKRNAEISEPKSSDENIDDFTEVNANIRNRYQKL